MSNGLDLDNRPRCFVCPDLGPNCLSKVYRQAAKVGTRKKRLTELTFHPMFITVVHLIFKEFCTWNLVIEPVFVGFFCEMQTTKVQTSLHKCKLYIL